MFIVMDENGTRLSKEFENALDAYIEDLHQARSDTGVYEIIGGNEYREMTLEEYHDLHQKFLEKNKKL